MGVNENGTVERKWRKERKGEERKGKGKRKGKERAQ